MNNHVITLLRFVILILIFSFCLSAVAQKRSTTLNEGFIYPPDQAKPRTWWHWTNSNVTHEGITKDLEWMKRVGIGGFQIADVASGQGQTVDKKIIFRSPEWLEAVRHAASEADRLGLEMALFSSAGWSLTGGPWVKPEQAMKKLVWSEMTVKGPQNFKGVLSAPPSVEGPIRNLSRGAKPGNGEPLFYGDCVVLAFPTPQDEVEAATVLPVVTTGAGAINPDALLDDDLNSSAAIRSGRGRGLVWAEYRYDKPFTARALTMANRAGIPVGTLKVSDDGVNYRTILILPGPQLYRSGKVATYSFPAVTARYFRLEFTGAPMRPADVMAESETLPDSVYTFGEIKFHIAARINRWEDKAGFYHLFNYEPVSSEPVPSSSTVDPAKIVDLTSLMLPDGSLNWKVPEGTWTIMRFGYSLTGAKNRPAVPAGLGYEVDKLSRDHTEAYIKEYMRPVAEALGDLYGKSLQYVLLDSWEAGMQNWTDNMLTEFRKRRGYDLTPYLPCLAGRVVGSSEVSDRLLWDFRRTLADMFAENHYKVLTEYLNKQGIRTYGEASGVSLEILEDALLCKKYVDIPMGEFWYRALHPELMYYQDVRGAASAAHIYGKNIAAAESFTGGGFESPFTLKKIGDYWFTQGINRFVFHTSAHQPLDTRPGNTMVGTHINRNITWAEQALPFMKYLARNSYMLQQGHFVADLAYLLDEGAPSTMPVWGAGLQPTPPEGYDFDYINADVLINLMSVSDDGRLILPGGMSYAIMILPGGRTMTLPVLKKLCDLVKSGATIIGPRPEQTPGLSGYPGSEQLLKNLADEIWGDLDGISRTRRSVGNGKVFWGTPLKTVLEEVEVRPDIEYGRLLDSKVDWIHRKTNDTDIYFVVNSSDKPLSTEVRFRVTGKEAELWDPVIGKIEEASYIFSENTTTVPLDLEARQAVFVVFRKNTENTTRSIPAKTSQVLVTVDGPWEVSFESALGAPEKVIFPELKSWTLIEDEGIKYYSGSALYEKEIRVPAGWLRQGTQLLLDLGNVADLAEVTVNGKNAGLLWQAPFRMDITGLLRKGTNTITIKVKNQWTNRLAADQKLPPERKILNSPLFVFRRGDPDPSGLLGPVRIIKCGF